MVTTHPTAIGHHRSSLAAIDNSRSLSQAVTANCCLSCQRSVMKLLQYFFTRMSSVIKRFGVVYSQLEDTPSLLIILLPKIYR